MNFQATKQSVPNQGPAPDWFLAAEVSWAATAPDEIFMPDPEFDIYSDIQPVLAPKGWTGLPQRKAAMLEALRVLAGLESSWTQSEGADQDGVGESDPMDQETGLFQVSANSMSLDPTGSLAGLVAAHCGGATDAASFIRQMKVDLSLAIEYAARLLRFSIKWDGPIERGNLKACLSIASMNEFEALIAQQGA